MSSWAKITGLKDRALHLASSGDRLAELAGLESRGDLIGRGELTFEADEEQQGREAMAETEAAYYAFNHRLSEPDHHADVGDQAVDFVKNLGLPYPWLLNSSSHFSMRCRALL